MKESTKFSTSFAFISIFSVLLLGCHDQNLQEGEEQNPECHPIEIQYPQSRWPTAEVDLDEDGSAEFVMEINPWNIASANGYQSMSFNGCDEVEFTSELSDVILQSPGSWVHGYPEIFWGNKPWNNYMATDIEVALPVKVAELEDFYVALEYDLSVPEGYPFNLAFETWLTTDSCRTNGVWTGDAEIMIWLFYQGLQPGGTLLRTDTIPMWINGRQVNEPFEVWYSPNFAGGWRYLAFRLSEPLDSAFVVLNPKRFIDKVRDYNLFDIDGLYMEDIEIGTEYGSPSVDEDRFHWTFRNFSITRSFPTKK